MHHLSFIESLHYSIKADTSPERNIQVQVKLANCTAATIYLSLTL